MSLTDLFPNFVGAPRVHLVGILGSGMKGLAEVLVDLGCEVSGSDQSKDVRVHQHFQQLGVRVLEFHDPGHVHHDHAAVIYSPAIPEMNIERHAARTRGIPEFSYVEALAKLMIGKVCVAIAGTHGKSTTTAMLGFILQSAGLKPTVVCGAERVDSGRNGFAGASDIFVVEACEYRGHFLNFSPQILCITNIEADHFDCFPTVDDTLKNYQALIDQMPDDGTLILNEDCQLTQQLRVPPKLKECRVSFRDATSKDAMTTPAVLKQTGHHNLTNANFAMTVAATLNIPPLESEAQLLKFSGLSRRYQKLPRRFNTRIIDDYAHHPTEIKATLNTAIQHESYGRLICVFQPHQVSRTEALFEDFTEALAIADVVYLLPVFGARENYESELVTTSQKIVHALRRKDVDARYIPSLDQVWRTLETDAHANDLIFTLGAGDIARIHHERI